jgi:hypothetical protein
MPFEKGNRYGKNGRPKVYEIPSEWAKRYSKAQAQAKFRKEEWAFDQHTWLKMWLDSGVSEHLGRQPHNYCMSRKDPIEAWGPHNCVIIPRRMHLKKKAFVNFHGYPDAPWEDRHNVEIKNES